MCRQLKLLLIACWIPVAAVAASDTGPLDYQRDIKPILEDYCFDCHADGAKKGGVAFDELSPENNFASSRDTWWQALRNLRAGVMPPYKKPQPTPAQKKLIARWIKFTVFGIDPASPDPGRVTIRRLNRSEYRHTIHDLIGVDYDTGEEFPPDDTGYGFDDIGDVLTLPPMLLEKYLAAARKIVSEAVPGVSGVPVEHVIPGKQFSSDGDRVAGRKGGLDQSYGPISLSYYTPAAVSNEFTAPHTGKYELGLELKATEKFVDNVFDYNKCRLIFRSDGQELLRREFSWQGGKPYHFDLDQTWPAGKHLLEFEVQPLTPDAKQTRTLSIQIKSVTVRGPMEFKYWVAPKDYSKFFPRKVPDDAAGRRAYAAELLGGFARRSYRRPVGSDTVDRLVALAEGVYSTPGKTFEQGISQGMVAILASPRFLFLEEESEPSHDGKYAFVDDYTLASRLSYFLWSSMPDDELFRLARAGSLRSNLTEQVSRMLKDDRSDAFVKDFTGQWLRARDIENIPIEAKEVLEREDPPDPEPERERKRFRQLRNRPDEQLTKAEREELDHLRKSLFGNESKPPRADLSDGLRRDMREETEMYFAHIFRDNHRLLDFISSDYTYLNERLARHYGITNVFGDKIHLVTLPPGNPRGGVLTQGTILAATSNPTRTSPVKRGVFILDSILGMPPPPPPPNIPPLEDAAKGLANHKPTLRETLAEHRKNPLCSSCHDRMDPLGLALENFNAMGMWRDSEFQQPIDASGRLISGEAFTNITDLKSILVKDHYEDFYRTITEKMLTYALGRGMEYYDTETVDEIVKRIESSDGRPSELLAGIVESAPFQRTRLGNKQSARIQSSPRRNRRNEEPETSTAMLRRIPAAGMADNEFGVPVHSGTYASISGAASAQPPPESGAEDTALQTLSRGNFADEQREASGLRRVHRRFFREEPAIQPSSVHARAEFGPGDLSHDPTSRSAERGLAPHAGEPQTSQLSAATQPATPSL